MLMCRASLWLFAWQHSRPKAPNRRRFHETFMQAGFSAHAHAVDLERGDEDGNDGTERQGKEEEGSILRSCTQHMLLIPLNWSQRFKNKLWK